MNDQVIRISPDEYAKLKNGSSKLNGWRDWGRLFMAIMVPLCLAILWFGQTAFQADQNKADITRHSRWIERHSADTESIKQSVADVEKTQAVILEKFTAVEKNIKRIAEKP